MIKYSATASPVATEELASMTQIMTNDRIPLDTSRWVSKDMRDVETMHGLVHSHPLLSILTYEKVCVAGGYLSRLACGDKIRGADIDLFMVGDYGRDDVKSICDAIIKAYGAAWWYRYGSVIVALVPDNGRTLEIQIICSDRKDLKDVLDSFDASYVQIGWGMGEDVDLYVTEEFMKYTALGIAKITRPSFSSLRLEKIHMRHFIAVTRKDQHIFHVARSKHDISKMQPVNLEHALDTVVFPGSFNPYLEIDYYAKDLLTIEEDLLEIKVAEDTIYACKGDQEIFKCSIKRMEYSDVLFMKGDTLLDPKQFHGQVLKGNIMTREEPDRSRNIYQIRFII